MTTRQKNSMKKPAVDQPTETTALLPEEYPPDKRVRISGQMKTEGYEKSTSGYGSQLKSTINPKEKPIIDLGNGRKLDTATWWGKQRFFIIKYINFIQAILWILGMSATLMATFILFGIWSLQIHSEYPWQLNPTPFHYDFEEISISSPSETCNEYLRMVVQEGHLPFAGLPMFMQACLSIAEPHASGPGGDTVLVYSRPADGRCLQVHGTDQFYDNLEKNELARLLLEQMRENILAHFMGETGIRLPGHLLAQIGMYELMQKEMKQHELDEAMRKATYVFRKEFVEDNLHFPITQRLYKVLTNVAALATRDSGAIKHLYGRNNEPPPVGTLFPVQKDELDKYFVVFFAPSQFVDFRKKIVTRISDAYKEFAAQLDVDHSIVFLNHVFARRKELLDNLEIPIVEDGQLLKLDRRLEICSPSALKFRNQEISQSFVPVVPKMLKTFKEAGLSFDQNFSAINEATFKQIVSQYAHRLPAIRRVTEEVHRLDEELLPKFRKQYESDAEEIRNSTMAKARQFLVGNGFVITRRGEAFAVSSTLGDSFGSMTGQGMLLFNNLNSDYGKDKEFGAYKNLQEPIIVNSNNEIEIAYAGPPGYFSYSLGIPRKMTSLVLSIFYNLGLENALTTPLLFYYRGSTLEYLKFPYHDAVKFNETGYSFKVEDYLESTMVKINASVDLSKREVWLTDEVAAVHHRRTMFYGMAKNTTIQIMPSGI